MTKSCVEIWVDKIKGDYERYSKAVKDEMSQASSKFLKSIQCKHLHTLHTMGSQYIYTSSNFLSVYHIFAGNFLGSEK